MHFRNRASFAFASIALGLVLGACQLFLNDDTTSCSTDGDCAARSAGSVCVEGLCGASSPKADGSVAEAGTPPECTTNLECSQRATAQALAHPVDAGSTDASLDAPATDGRVPAVCVKSVGKCAELLSADCTSYSGDDLDENSIVLGSMFLLTGSSAPSNIPRAKAVQLATEELNSAVAGNGIPSVDGGARRPLLTLYCDEVVNATRAAEHLVNDLHVPAIIGPARGENVTNFTQNLTAKAGTLIMTPSATPSAITDLVDNGLTWRIIPSDAQRAPLFIRQINEIEIAVKAALPQPARPLKLAIAFRNDALGASNRDALVSGLQFNGQFLTLPPNSGVGGLVSLDQYDFTDPDAQKALALKYATMFKPDILVVVANEVTTIPVEYEKQRLAMGDSSAPKAYLVANDVAKIPAWYTPAKAILGANYEDFRKRVRGFGVRSDGSSISVNSNFLGAYTARFPGVDTNSSAIAASYDATYAVAYGIAASANQPLTGNAIAKGLSSLGSGDTIPVGVINANKAMQLLVGGTSISLVGTLSALKWDVKGDIVGGTLESWCVNTTGSGFTAAGETFDVFGRTFTPASNSYIPCP